MVATTYTGEPITGELITREEIAAAESAGASENELLQLLNLKEQAANFSAAFEHLMSAGDYVEGTDLEPEYRRLLDRGLTLRDQIATALAAIDSAFGWIRNLIPGLSGNALGRTTLGIAPLIPIAAIAAVVTGLTVWLKDYSKFAKRYAEQRRIADDLVQQGLAPAEAQRQAAAAVASTTPGFFAPLADALPWVAAGVGGYLFWRLIRGAR